MERLGGEVRSVLGRLGPADGDLVAIVRAWPTAVGETVARNAWPARLARDGTLHVNASSATWAFELGRLAETILEGLRARLGEDTPPALRVAPGPVPEPPSAAVAEGAASKFQVGEGDRQEASGWAAAIEDEELRELVSRAAAASLARARSSRGF
jgi:hypothetical protein